MTESEVGLVREYLALLREWSEVAGSEVCQHQCCDNFGADEHEPDQICQGQRAGDAAAVVLLSRPDDGPSVTSGDAPFTQRPSRT